MSIAHFGPAGNSISFTGKTNLEIPPYLADMGLNAFEYQCGRGVKISEKSANAFGQVAKSFGVTLSLHAPYYISLSSEDEETRLKSIDYILSSAKAIKAMGGSRIIVHTGSVGKRERPEALALAKDTLKLALKELDKAGLGTVTICPETMGKTGQLGTLDEVLSVCYMDERLVPCIDFGHLYARQFGEIDYIEILDKIKNVLGEYRYKNFHTHFSKIAFTTPGGEKSHTTFDDPKWGPDPEPLIKIIAERGLTPTIICESNGTQAEDARYMKNLYEENSI